MSDKQTCCVAYGEALAQYTGGYPEKVKLFAAGFVHGQAEKVYLGACRACMFRPSAVHIDMMDAVCADAAERYGLAFRYYAKPGEIWLTKSPDYLDEVMKLVPNSPTWHFGRAMLCGVPHEEIDFEFHKRQGYGQSCDVVEKSVASTIDLAKFNVTEIVNAGKTFVPTKKYAGFSPSGVCLESDDGVAWSEVKERA